MYRAHIELFHVARDAREARLILGVAVQTYVTLDDSTCRHPATESKQLLTMHGTHICQ